LIFIFFVLFILVIIAGCKLHKNTITFDPKVDESASETSLDINTEDIKLAVTSIIGSNLETDSDYHVIEGVASSNTNEIKVNDYILQRYSPGQTGWSYIASTDLDTLAEGENKYAVRAYDEDGNEIGAQDFTITYTPVKVVENTEDTEKDQNLPSVGISGWITFIISLVISIGYFAFRRLKKIFIRNI
ncbi:hypothetical protein KKF04_00450, partial [Patescibacteria group bacterium]|nr:hypothetical protein [Patescibacteria group bacterium]